MINVIMIGNVSQEPILRTVGPNSNVLNFSIASNDKRNKGSKPIFMSCALFGRGADALQPYITKGTKLHIMGRLTINEWVAKDGQKRTAFNVVVDNIELLGEKSNGVAQPPPPAPAPSIQQPLPMPPPAMAAAPAAPGQDDPFAGMPDGIDF